MCAIFFSFFHLICLIAQNQPSNKPPNGLEIQCSLVLSFNSGGLLNSEVFHFQKHLRASYWPNCAQDLPILIKFKFVCYGHIEEKKLALYVSWFKFKGHSPMFSVSKSEIFQFSSSELKICFGSRTKSFEVRGLTLWNKAFYLCHIGL